MLFKRRHPPSIQERVRVSLWPRRSWARSFRYVIQRIWRLNGTPRSIAVGCAAGVFISFTPFLGIHFILAGLIAWALGGNIIASALGTFFGNPLSFPFIWISTFKTGSWVLGTGGHMKPHELQERFSRLSEGLFSFSTDGVISAMESLWPVIKPMAIGAVPLGLVASLISYVIVRKAVDSYQARAAKRKMPDGTGTAQA